MRLLAEELLGLAGDSGILSGCDGRDGRGIGTRAGERLRSLYFRFLVLISEDSANETFCHTGALLNSFIFRFPPAHPLNQTRGKNAYATEERRLGAGI